MASKPQKSDENKSFKRKKEPEAEDSTHAPCSSPSDNFQAGDVEMLIKGLNNEINLLFDKYAKILNERSEVDAAYVLEFDGILKEARSVEIHLKQKRESLRNRLTKIANTLQR
ncbi:hypothetical protein XENTR_v10018830 [Xenopus tropicalis]|uniref:Testis-expressed protein 12 n=1 Tax=Xenopus tropicalis TaxID=8364 RepID=A0A8J0T2P7_XENTR|nr:testis-expressed protein 12 [Xenopus tropicalis]KAE8592639.1 hypothetical protein XENTR_v10018830 [Xenopus tropicalis]KAE8592640.1 hypothetical protein XENTR_v10018830 [Xenopus tropicalis]KAE8592641.1 hypothetical protein XENTR_v10018830 [Xenopus tropicalis]|eukprot:XP_017951530.1 PREDICTED: testis-expressed sequence 12 protein [Xenopus tropicalis]